MAPGREGLQHGEHGGGGSGSGAGLAAHEAAVTLDEQHHRGLGRFVGVLPDPGAVRVAGAEGRAHGLAQGLCIERPARLQVGKQSGCGGQQRGRLGADARGIGNRWGWGMGWRAGGRAGAFAAGWASSMNDLPIGKGGPEPWPGPYGSGEGQGGAGSRCPRSPGPGSPGLSATRLLAGGGTDMEDYAGVARDVRPVRCRCACPGVGGQEPG